MTDQERVDVLDPSGQEQSIPKDNLSKAIGLGYKISGKVSPPELPVIPASVSVAAGQTAVLDPDGNLQSIDSSKLEQAKQMGYKTQSDAGSDHIVSALKSKFGETGTDLLNLVHSGISSLTYGQGDKALKGITDLVTPHLGVDNINKLEEQYGIPKEQFGQTIVNAFHKIANESPISSAVGGIAGAVAPMLMTGGAGVLGEGALASDVSAGVKALVGTKSFGARVLGNTLGEAAGGAALMSPQALAQATLDKDPKAAGETLAWGALAGGGFGMLMGTAGEAARGIKTGTEAVKGMLDPTGKVAENLKNNKTLNAIANKFYPPNVSEIGEDGEKVITPTSLSDTLLGKALGMTPTERAKLGTIAQQHESLGTIVNAIGPKEIGKMSNKEFAQKIMDFTDLTGPRIGKLINKMDEAVAPNDIDLLPSYFTQRNSLQEIYDGFKDDPIYGSEKRYVSDVIDHLEKISPDGENLTFKQQQDFKVFLQGKAKYNMMNSSDLNDVKMNVAKIAKTAMDDAGDSVASKAGEPALIDQWNQQKKLYGIGSSLYGSAEKIVNGKEAGGKLESGHVIGAIAGHLVGSMMGVPYLGSLIGAVAKPLLEHWARDNAPTKIAMFLRKNAQTQNIGTYVALDASKILETKIQDIPKILRGGKVALVGNALRDTLGDESNGLSKTQQFERHNDHLNSMVANPQVLDQQVKALTEPINYHHPEVGKAMEDAIKAKIIFLHNNLPKRMSMPAAFSKEKAWEPSTQQIDEYNKLLAVAEDPFHVLSELKNGTLTKAQVGAMSTLNPAILAQMRDEIMKEAYSGKSDLSYQEKLSVALLMGTDMGTGLANVQQMQSMYPPNSAAQQVAPPPKKTRGTASHLSSSAGAQYQTPAQIAGVGHINAMSRK